MAILIEAEDLNLEHYVVEDFSVIETNDDTITADAQGISLFNASDLTGTASFLASEFNLSGTYDLGISYFDENDGEAELQVLVNDEVVGDLLLNENTSSGFPTEDTSRGYVIENLLIQPSNTITIRGTADGSEWARVDSIAFSLENNSGSSLPSDPNPSSFREFTGSILRDMTQAGNAGGSSLFGLPPDLIDILNPILSNPSDPISPVPEPLPGEQIFEE